MNQWKFDGIIGHIFTYDQHLGMLFCSCNKMAVRVSKKQMIPTSERHIKNWADAGAYLRIRDLSLTTRIKAKEKTNGESSMVHNPSGSGPDSGNLSHG